MCDRHVVLALFLLSMSIYRVSSEITFDITVESNPKLFANFTYHLHDGMMDMSAILLRTLEGKIMWKCDCYRLLSNKKRIKYMDVPKLNYCNMRRNLDQVPFLSNIVKHLGKYGNFTPFCPWKNGLYQQQNMPVDENFLPMKNFIPKGRYLLVSIITDENKKPEPMMKFIVTINVL